MAHLSLNSPIGALSVFEEDEQIVAVDWGRAAGPTETPLLRAARDQLTAYFEQRLTEFDLPLAPGGTDFQKAVCKAMYAIPFGVTRTYGDLAHDLGSAARAVGGACGRNPIPIIIPCHRVLGANGKMTGYSGAGGIKTKLALLYLEGITPPQESQPRLI